MEIQFFFDPACPWCFIGKRRLEQALDARPDLSVRIKWRAFELNPEIPVRGMERTRYLASKFSGTRQAAQVFENIRGVGESVGIDFTFEKIQHTPNTVDAHRLINFAAESMRGDLVVERLFNAYFIDGADIGDRSTLITIAINAGLDAGKAAAELSSDRHFDTLRSDAAQARALGVQGAPSFIFDNQYLLSGAQEPEFFLPIFDLVGQKARGVMVE